MVRVKAHVRKTKKFPIIRELKSDRKLIYAVKKAGIKTFNPKGEWNGYGYERLPLVAEINNEDEAKLFAKLKRKVTIARKKEGPPLSPEERKRNGRKD